MPAPRRIPGADQAPSVQGGRLPYRRVCVRFRAGVVIDFAIAIICSYSKYEWYDYSYYDDELVTI